jgi:hypothetical protein
LKLDDFNIQIKAWFETETAGIIAAAEDRIHIETMRIIVALEAAADEFRLREERRIWGAVHVLVAGVQA